MTMLDLDRVDLGELSSALEDNSPDHAWWLDPVSGALELRSEYFDDFEEDEEPSARMRRRAIAWLCDHELIASEVAERTLDAVEEEPDLPELGGDLDAHGIARAVAADLRALYGSRLKDVLCSAHGLAGTLILNRTSTCSSCSTRFLHAAGSSSGWTPSCGATRLPTTWS